MQAYGLSNLIASTTATGGTVTAGRGFLTKKDMIV
jgi:hypothetical protein